MRTKSEDEKVEKEVENKICDGVNGGVGSVDTHRQNSGESERAPTARSQSSLTARHSAEQSTAHMAKS